MKVRYNSWVLLGALLLCNLAHAGLVARDANGDLTVDSYYDTDFNVTFLLAPNPAATTFSEAQLWVDNLIVGAFSDWRLPTADAGCNLGSGGGNCINGELGHLYYTELGNSYLQYSDLGPFDGYYFGAPTTIIWTGTQSSASRHWVFGFSDGHQGSYPDVLNATAVAVRDGDVLPLQVPEPMSVHLVVAALSILALFSSRRERSSSKLAP